MSRGPYIRWKAMGEVYQEMPTASQMRDIGGSLCVDRFVIKYNDHNDERRPWHLLERRGAGADRPFDTDEFIDDFARFPSAVADAKRRANERTLRLVS